MASMRAAFGRTVTDLLDEDPRVALVLAEISASEYLGSALRRHPERAVNIGIMEQAMVGIAAGFAMEGFHPIAHSIAPFMAERPYEQLKIDFGYQGLGGTFVGVGASYDYAAEGGTHHAPADATVMLAIPGMEVLVPGHGDEIAALLRATYADGRPTYVRASTSTEPRTARRGSRPDRGAPPRPRRDGARVRSDARAHARGVRRARRDGALRDESAPVRRGGARASRRRRSGSSSPSSRSTKGRPRSWSLRRSATGGRSTSPSASRARSSIRMAPPPISTDPCGWTPQDPVEDPRRADRSAR